MGELGFHWIGRVIQLHPYLTYLFGFLVPVAGAYWLFGVLPYTRPCTDRLLSPWHIRRPAVPGVLERYATWEWAAESHLTPFGRWLFQEIARQDVALLDLLRSAELELPAVAPALYVGGASEVDPEIIRRLAASVGADDHQINRLLRAQREAGCEMNRQP
jgi:hypothetical protein